ncbi:MAG: hypothetical protein KatS3mg102_0559 [Planctomycetota bacterium]|nr:MAG: hypothetical protein KatS3mg102_0559 [Planctomycetota bacterium]
MRRLVKLQPHARSSHWRAAPAVPRWCGALLGAVLLVAAPAAATTVVLLDDDALVARAVAIVHGDVVGKRCARTPDGRIFTEYRFAIREMLKGEAPPSGVVSFREWGGELDGLRYWIPGTGRFEIGDEVIVFLGATDATTAVGFTTGLAQGKFRVVRNARGARAIRQLGTLVTIDEESGEPVAHAERDEHDLEALLARIRARVRGERGR